MTLVLLIGLLFAGASIALTLRAIALPGIQAAERVGVIGAYGYAGEAKEERPGGLGALATAVGQMLANRYEGRFDEDEIRRQLTGAGIYKVQPLTFLGYRALAGVAVPGTLLWFAVTTGLPVAMAAALMALGVLLGFRVPAIVLDRRTKQRLATIEYDMPDLVDLLVVTVEAGIAFSGSVQMAAGRMKGPLGDELRLALQEQKMGLSTGESLSNMMGRVDTPSMRSFVRSILQGETLGVSIGQILRNLSLEMRKRRRARAEEKAQKAPIKLLFPLIFLIFPSLFIVLLFPAIHNFSQAFG